MLRERGLLAADVRVIPAAAGGPKGLVLNTLDRFIFGHWLRGSSQTVHLLGASIGAWRMASACLPDPDSALAQLASDYIAQDYPHAPGKAPTARDVSAAFGARIDERFSGRAGEPWRTRITACMCSPAAGATCCGAMVACARRSAMPAPLRPTW